MKRYFLNKTKIVIILFTVTFLTVCVFVWQKYPFAVERYKTIKLGMQTAEKTGDSTGWAAPYDRVPEGIGFYVYSLGDNGMCIGSDCGMGGYFIECLGGWVSGYKDVGEVIDYGLRDAGVDINKQKVITIANKDAKIVGIYPGASIKNLPYIMNNHRDLVSDERYKACLDSLPGRWK